ncbi:menin-like [Haliotis rufescens]|uniref:menin-like n=1 Tax=Haliotis rufescens TaxID=6454 RepID=UPI00201F1841|nr:menin-like [Haliotis rufescens]
MAGFRDREKQHFPLQSIQSAVDLFRDQLANSEEPNLALLSIVLGCIENTLTLNRAVSSRDDKAKGLEPIFPVIELSTVEALYTKFVTLVKSSVDLSNNTGEYSSRELVKKVSDVIWSSLTRSYYKDKAHLQSLYSFLTGNKLDCFGVAFAVVAACQVLRLNDVHLALSEDHAWVVFGKDLTESAEVTWHGKGNEDKRGQPINVGVTEKSWLYLNGQPVVCSRHMETAAIVSGINPSLNATMDSVEMGSLQQELLWLLYDKGHLAKYPMALGNLGDLEEISTSPGRPPPLELFKEAITSCKKNYNNQHVYPYTYLGGFLYRKKLYKDAIQAWADASSVVKSFNYNREDEEIYKEFLEIANELVPNIVRSVASELHRNSETRPLLQDPEVYKDILRFYDGICEWEEGSSTPVLHVGWAQHLVYTLSKFDPRVRSFLDVGASDGDDDDEEEENQEPKAKRESTRRASHSDGTAPVGRGRRGRKKAANDAETKNDVKSNGNGVSVNGKSDDDQIKSTIEELVSKVGEEGQNDTPNPNIAALAQACSESILNKDYLLGGGEPFTTTATAIATSTSSEPRVEINEFLSTKSNGTPFMGLTVETMLKAESPADMMLCRKETDSQPAPDDLGTKVDILASLDPVSLSLRSEKMKGLKKLLTSSKLNTSAIKLQLTAQSQVHLKHSKRGSEAEMASMRKRTRRE